MAAYAAEHGCSTYREVAAHFRISPSALRQRFTGASTLKTRTLHQFVDGVSSPEHKRRIASAWETVAMAERPAQAPPAPVTEPARRIAALSRLDLPEEALAMARRANLASLDDDERWHVLLQWGTLAFRLDAPGDALEAARKLKAWGLESRRNDRVGFALAMEARAAHRADFPPEQVAAVIHEARAVLRSLPREAKDGFVARLASDMVLSVVVTDVLRVHERSGGQEGRLRRYLGVARQRLTRSQSEAGSASARQMEALLLLGLGHFAAAEDALDEAMRSAGGTEQAFLACGETMGKALAARGERARAKEHLRRLSEVSLRRRYVYVYRVAQRDLARLETLGRS